jgi:hypothetical protein
LTKPPFTILNLKSKIFIKKTFLFIKISVAVSMKNITSKTRGSQEPVIAHLVFNLTSKVDRKWEKGVLSKIISIFFPHINIHGHILYIIHYSKLLNKNTLFIHGCTLYIFNYGKLLNENTDCISCIYYLYME